MAKRKRLSPGPLASGVLPPNLDAKAHNSWAGAGTRAPIAHVAGDAAAQSAFEEVAGELRSAKAEGRMVMQLPLASVQAGHLTRDRLAVDAEEMAVLKDSLRARGQQTPIEVVDLGAGAYGLISGWRRLRALQELFDETAETEFGVVQALVRIPDDAAAAYCAMVEENEIRTDLSFYERANIAVQAVRQGIYGDVKAAVQGLFSAVRAPKRSKILRFTLLVDALDDRLRFPAAIPEKLGLALAQALQTREGFERQLREALRKASSDSPARERTVLERTLRSSSAPSAPSPAETEEVIPGIVMKRTGKGVTLAGAHVDAPFIEDLRNWLAARGTGNNS